MVFFYHEVSLLLDNIKEWDSKSENKKTNWEKQNRTNKQKNVIHKDVLLFLNRD